MNPLPPVHTGPISTFPQQQRPPVQDFVVVPSMFAAGDSSLSNNDEEEGNENEHHSLPNPEDHFAATNATANATAASTTTTHHQHQHQPQHSNRTRTVPNSEALANDNTNHITTTVVGVDGLTLNHLTIRITTRPIMSWSPQLIHADGSSHTMTIDLPEELAANTTRVITQQGWQDLYHIIATAVAKNTSESILLFWCIGLLLMVMALVLLFGLVGRGLSARLGVLVGVLGLASLCGIAHTVVRRVRVQRAVRKCVEECFYDAEIEEAEEAIATAAIAFATELENGTANVNVNVNVNASNQNSGSISETDVEQQQKQQQQQQQQTANNSVNDGMLFVGGGLDGLQELEDAVVANVVDAGGNNSGAAGGATGASVFGRVLLRQRLNSHSSSHSHSNNNNNPLAGNIGANVTTSNRRRLNTDSSAASSSMVFDEDRRNRAISRDGMYCVSWKWEYLGMDAVVKISWE